MTFAHTVSGKKAMGDGEMQMRKLREKFYLHKRCPALQKVLEYGERKALTDG